MIVFLDSNHEKVPYPPAYGEIYPVVPAAEMMASGPDLGWQPVGNAVVVTAQQPPVYVTQAQHTGKNMFTEFESHFLTWNAIAVTSMVLGNQSRVGLFPVKLQPCPHCQTESKTTIKQEPTLRTHLLALIMCAMW